MTARETTPAAAPALAPWPERSFEDIVVPPINALILAEHLPNAQLIVYSDSSHGAQYQHAKMFLEHVKLFLDE